jgi:hypothetical protein
MLAFRWNPDVTLADVLTMIGFTLTFIAVVAAVRGIRHNQAVERGRFLSEVMDRLFRDDSVRKFWYQLDYDQWRFDQMAFPGSDEERWLDHLLYQFALVGRLVKLGVLSQEEVTAIGFEAARVLTDSAEVQKYLEWLREQYALTGQPSTPFPDAIYLAQLVKPQRKGPKA